MPHNRFTGYRIDLEDRRWLAKSEVAALPMLMRTTETTLREYDPRPWIRTENQGPVGRCAGMAETTAGELVYHDATGGRVIQFNGHYTYIQAQKLDRLIGRDAGATIASVVQSGRVNGLCPTGEGFSDPEFPNWRYDNPGRYTTQLPAAADRVAAKFKLGSHTMLRSLDDIVTYQQSGAGHVLVGTAWGNWGPDSQGYIRSFNGGGRSGHAWVFGGWLANGCLLLLNSHGRGWGLNGWAYATPEFVKAMYQHPHTVVAGVSDLTVPRYRPRDWMAKENRYVRFRRRNSRTNVA